MLDFAPAIVYDLGQMHCSLTVPNAGLEEPALGGPAQEATQRRQTNGAL